ncbi:MAG: hypothetical protein KC421_13590, partial [Anaerolineales bacterium]|nr:hypothetical protein [Anaerolineales bacterium]
PGKKPGDKLKSGDKIYLLNMHPGAGYLDTFEWVRNLEPFKDYPMTIGVFTSSVPNRGGGVSGRWEIYLEPNETTASDAGASAQSIHVGSTIILKNNYPGAGFLFAYGPGGEAVYKHKSEMFEEYSGAKKFVFTGQTDQHGKNGASYTWKIIPVGLIESLYRVENQWGDNENAPWHETGIFKIGSGQKGRVSELQLSRPDPQNETLTGYVKFEGDPVKYNIEAAPGERPIIYTITLNVSETEKQDEEWVLGSREFQRLESVKIEADKKDGTLRGEIQYEGERPIRIKAAPGSDDNEILYDFFHSDLLKGRSQKMQGVMDTTFTVMSDTIQAFDAIQEKVAQSTSGDTGSQNEGSQNSSTGTFLTDVDFDFQKGQLQNLKKLSEILNAFYAYKLKYLMKQSFKNHRKDQTLAPLYLVRQSFQQLAADHEIIQQAAVQRRWTYGFNVKDDGYFISEQAVELLIMDKLAIKAIVPFKHLLPSGKDENGLAIISYLSERTHIRRLPYTDRFIMIGVSYDRVPQAGSLFDDRALFERPFHAFELMAIPHEVGHYIYEHGKLEDGRSFPQVCKQFEGNNPYHRWGEEIFADLYGCIVTGPLTVLSMRALLVSINRERAWKDDEHHPTPVLRVFILNEILRILKEMNPDKYDFSDVTDRLDEDWAGILASWGYARVQPADEQQASKRPARIYLHDNSAIHLEQIVNIDRVINAIRPIIVEFATHLLAHLDQQSGSQDQNDGLQFTIPWVGCSAQETDKKPEAKLDDYSETMRNLTNRKFAGKKAPHKTKLSIDIDKDKPDMTNPENPRKQFLPDELMRYYLDNWGDSGPTGSGIGGY